jgi:UTP--glucose-1-phosphate uridylyltransferase
MNVSRAVITAASRSQRNLPLQTLVDRDGRTKSLLTLLIQEALRAGIDAICIVVCPGDEATYRTAAGEHSAHLEFVAQTEPLGYGHAVWCARAFVGDAPFLHMIGDHVFVSSDEAGNAAQVVDTAKANGCAVSGVQPTRESLLPYFGAVGGQRVKGTKDLYVIDRVSEKPTPTEAEQTLLVPGLRAGHYLCYFGIHVLTPTVIDLLDASVQAHGDQGRVELSPVLAELAQREQYLAIETKGQRYPVDARYGLLTAQLALALSGPDRPEVLSLLCELLAQREMSLPRTA